MAWYWSDDVARAAVEAGLATEQSVQDWVARPVAFAAGDGLSLADVAARLLGIDEVEAPGAA